MDKMRVAKKMGKLPDYLRKSQLKSILSSENEDFRGSHFKNEAYKRLYPRKVKKIREHKFRGMQV